MTFRKPEAIVIRESSTLVTIKNVSHTSQSSLHSSSFSPAELCFQGVLITLFRNAWEVRVQLFTLQVIKERRILCLWWRFRNDRKLVCVCVRENQPLTSIQVHFQSYFFTILRTQLISKATMTTISTYYNIVEYLTHFVSVNFPLKFLIHPLLLCLKNHKPNTSPSLNPSQSPAHLRAKMGGKEAEKLGKKNCIHTNTS